MLCSSTMKNASNGIVSTLSPKYQVTEPSVLGGVSLGSKFGKTGTITGQMFRRNPCYRDTAPTTNSVFRKRLRGL